MNPNLRNTVAATMLIATTGVLAADETVPARAEGMLVTVTATVEAVDLKARTVDLKREDGSMVTIEADDEVRNLEQVEVGDIVEVDYYEILVTALEPTATGVRERVERVETERAAPGEKPAGAVTRTVEIIASVVELDRENRLATLKGARETITVKVDEDVDLDKVKVGDDVRALYAETIAITVRKPEAK